MTKPAVLMGLVLIGMLSFAVFQVENRVQSLRGEMDEINRQITNDRESIHTLKAEWSYLTRPERIKKMSEKHLEISSVDINKIMDIEQIPVSRFMVSDR